MFPSSSTTLKICITFSLLKITLSNLTPAPNVKFSEVFVPDSNKHFLVNVKCVGVSLSYCDIFSTRESSDDDVLKLTSSNNLKFLPVLDENILSALTHQCVI